MVSKILKEHWRTSKQHGVKFNNAVPKRIALGWQPIDTTHYEFFVRDNGIGIAPQYQEQIFRVFERLHTHAEYEGTGIGLAIVQKAVGKLGGSVRLESEPGQGSTFFITLPAKLQIGSWLSCRSNHFLSQVRDLYE